MQHVSIHLHKSETRHKFKAMQIRMVRTNCANKLCKQAVQTSCDKVWRKAACQAAKISSPRTRIGKSEEPLKRQALLTLPKAETFTGTTCLCTHLVSCEIIHVACKDSKMARVSCKWRRDEGPQREKTQIYLQQLIRSQLGLQHSLHQECQLQEILGNTKCEQQEDKFDHPQTTLCLPPF